MLLAVVNEIEARWRKRRVEPRQHFSRDRTGFLGVHGLYIEELNANEAIQDAREGRRSESEVRRAGLYCARRVQGAVSACRFRRTWHLAVSVPGSCPGTQCEV
jgi:hypothetical protein